MLACIMLHSLCAHVTPLEVDSRLRLRLSNCTYGGAGSPLLSNSNPRVSFLPSTDAQFISTEGPGLPASQMVIPWVGVPRGAMQYVRVGAPHMCVLHGESVTLVLGTGQAGSSPVETCSSERVLGRVATVAGESWTGGGENLPVTPRPDIPEPCLPSPHGGPYSSGNPR